MMKSCVLLNGQVINIGEWDYQIEQVELKPAVIDEETQEIIEPAEYEEVVRNPMPDGAVVEERDFGYSEDRGWYEVGTKAPLSEIEKLRLEQAQANAELFEMMLTLTGGGTV